MKFPCKSCDAEIRNKEIDVLIEQSRDEFFQQQCPRCGDTNSYSWLRISQIPEKT